MKRIAILTPGFAPQLSISADYFDIDLQGAIVTPWAQFMLDQCIETGQSRYCDTIHRDPVTGSLGLGEGYIDARLTNIGGLKISGIDVIADYVQPIGRFGDLQFSFVGTYLDSVQRQDLPGQTIEECVGKYASPCGRPQPEFASNLRGTWLMPWNLSVSLLWRYTSKIIRLEEGFQDFELPSTDYFDLSALWDPTDSMSLRFGINNLFDEDPPFCPCFSGNTWPEGYDALGRYVFAGINYRL